MYLVLIDELSKSNSCMLPYSSTAFRKVLSLGKCVDIQRWKVLQGSWALDFFFFAPTHASYVGATLGDLIWE